MQDAPPESALPGWLGIALACAAGTATIVTAVMPYIVEKLRAGRTDGYVAVVDEAMDDLRLQRDQYKKQVIRLQRRVAEQQRRIDELEAKVRQLGGEP